MSAEPNVSNDSMAPSADLGISGALSFRGADVLLVHIPGVLERCAWPGNRDAMRRTLADKQRDAYGKRGVTSTLLLRLGAVRACEKSKTSPSVRRPAGRMLNLVGSFDRPPGCRTWPRSPSNNGQKGSER